MILTLQILKNEVNLESTVAPIHSDIQKLKRIAYYIVLGMIAIKPKWPFGGIYV